MVVDLKNGLPDARLIAPDGEYEIFEATGTPYFIYYEPIEDPPEKMPEAIMEEAEYNYDLVFRQPKSAIPRIESMLEKYPNHPNHPILLNHLSVAYANIRDNKTMERLVLQNCKENPKYLFAKLNFARICIYNGEPWKVPAIFNHDFDLNKLYPERKRRFHITEVIGILAVEGNYCHAIGELEMAKRLLKSLEKLAPKHAETHQLKRLVRPNIFRRMFRRLLSPLKSNETQIKGVR